MIKTLRLIIFFYISFVSLNINAGEVITNSRLEGTALSNAGANLIVRYDKYLNLPYPGSNPFALINSSKGMIEFGIDETKKVFHSSDFTSILTVTYFTKDFNLNISSPQVQILEVDYFPNKSYTGQDLFKIDNVAYLEITNINVITYANYGLSNQTIVSNPSDLYLETSIAVTENLLFDFSTSLPLSTKIGYNKLPNATNPTELETWWDYLPGAEEYELEYIYIDDYDASDYNSAKSTANINYDFAHDATRIITHNQFYKIPLIYEKGWIIFRVRGIGRSQSNNNDVRLEGTWSNGSYITGALSNFVGAFSNQSFHITTAHESDNINWSSNITFAENGKSGLGISYEDGVMKNRQSVAKLNTEDKTIVQASLYDWQGRPAVSILPTPFNDNFLSYKKDLNKTTSGEQFDKNVFDNVANFANSCSPTGLIIDPVNSTGAAKYYSPENNTGQEAQQALVPDAHGLPYVQVEYYPDQTGRIKRQSMPGSTHFLGSEKDNQFFYSQPTQEELVRLFGTEVGAYDEYEKQIDIDPNGQKSVVYSDDEGRTIATGLMNAAPASLIPLADAIDPLISQTYTTTLVNNVNDPSSYVLGLTNTFYASQNEIEKITYEVTASQYKDIVCLPEMCFDCIYELEISIKDDCGLELLDGDIVADGNQPIVKILGRYTSGSSPEFSTTCGNISALHFSLDPTPFTFTAPKNGNYYLSKILKLSTKPLLEYAQEFVKNNECVHTLEYFQQQSLANIDLSGCEYLDCAQCSTTVNSFIASLPENSLTAAQQAELLAKCDLKCNLEQDICGSKEMLLLKDFKPGGYFAKYDVSEPDFVPVPDAGIGGSYTYSVSIFNSSNNIESILFGTTPSTPKWYDILPVSYGSYTTLDPISNLPVAPNALSVVNYVTTYNENYTKPWLKLHPEFCRLQFNCDGLINALNSYTKTLEGINSFDDACRLGYLFPIPASTSFNNAPDISTCPSCPSVTNHYIPLVGFTGTSYLNTAAISSQLAAITASLQSHAFVNDAGTSTSPYNIYEYSMVIGDNTTSIGTDPFGNGCNKDKQWLFYKRIYFSYITTLMNQLQIAYVGGWDNADGGCLTNFSGLPGYVKIFPDINLLTSGGALSGFGNGATTGAGGQTAAGDAIAAQCTSYCHSYIDNWINELTDCTISTTDKPFVTAALEAVCNSGCDASDPFGASNSYNSVPITLTNSSIVNVQDFQEVLTAFGYNFSNTCSSYLINAPKPKGYSFSSTSATNPIVDACGCDAILNAHNSYTTGIDNNTINGCLISEADYVKQQLDVTLPYLSSYVCVCQQAKTSTGYNFSTIDHELLQTLPLPEKLACKNCIPCAYLSEVLIPEDPTTLNPVILTNYLNNSLNMNNSYEDWIQFLNDCDYNALSGGGYSGTGGINVLTTPQAFDFKTLLSSLAANNFLIPNTSSTLYTLNATNAPGFFNSTLMTPANAGANISVLVSYPAPNTLNLSLTSSLSTPYPCNFTLVSTTGYAFPDFSTISPPSFYDFKGKCETENEGDCKDFLVTFSYVMANGYFQSYILDGTNTCFVTLKQAQIALPAKNICAPYLCSRGLDSEPIPPNNCLSTLVNNALNSAQTVYKTYIDQQVDQFLASYKDYCYTHVTETTKRLYTISEYHYTLFYYDRAGNLVHTVPPAGVSVITNATDITNAISYVKGTSTTPVYPAHSLNNPGNNITSYITHTQYNTFDAPTSQITPDGGETTYFYDHVGRLGVSQDSKQAPFNWYSYSLYDDLGRITEVGTFVLTSGFGDVFNENTLKNPVTWATFIADHAKIQVTRTYYDNPLNTYSDAQFSGGQQNLRNRVAATTYEEAPDNDPDVYNYATFFSYDDHGHVDHVMQHNPQMHVYNAANEFKHIEYEYEIVSSNVNKVIYQRNQPDQWFHKYEYDADNRLHTVYTSDNDLVYQRDAKYFYYQHGPLARTELGEKQVQGTDYAFTLQGWVKGVNSTILDETKDIGKDGAPGNDYMSSFNDVHKDFGRDASSYSLNYFGGDYNPIKTASQNFLADMTNLNSGTATGFKLSADAPDLYNGNITSMVTSIYDVNILSVDKGKAKPQITGYRYDQLNRLKHMKAYSSMQIATGAHHSEAINLSTNEWTTPDATQNYSGVYEMDFDYDKLGNIQTLKREGDAEFIVGLGWKANIMDDLVYSYNSAPVAFNSLPGKQYTLNNRLTQVVDNTSTTADLNYGNDFDGTHVYDYNNIGSLTQDLSEEIDLIEWTDAKKVKSVIRTATSIKPDLYFAFDAFGRRISKTVIGKSAPGVQDPSTTKITHYVLDVDGNNLAIYEEELNATTIKCTSRTILGSDRLGVNNKEVNMFTTVTPPVTKAIVFGEKDYETHNHLGNIITTISDRKIQKNVTTLDVVDYYTPDIKTTTDYYAGGMPMGGARSFNLDEYKYGHNGQEKDDEIFQGAYTAEFWEYDSRILRRWNIDPIRKPWESSYACFRGNPIYFADPSGLDGENPDGGCPDDRPSGGGDHTYSSPSTPSTPDRFLSRGESGTQADGGGSGGGSSGSESSASTKKSVPPSSTAQNKPIISQTTENIVGSIDLGLDLVEKLAPLQRDAGILESGRFKMKVNDVEKIMKQGFQGNKSIPSGAVQEAKIAFAAKTAAKLKILNYVKVAGYVANGAGMVMTVVKMANGDKSPKNKYDLVMGGVGFIPGPGWAISGGYFLGSLIVGEDNMNAGIEVSERGVSQGWEAVHTQNQNTDATTHIVCFTKGTLVYTPKGLIKIEEIKSSDNVYSYNLVGDSIMVDTVVNVLNRYTDHIYKIKVGDEIIEATSEHPFYVVGKDWVKAKDLKQGDKLKTSSKSTLTISEINYSEVEVMVYNIEVNKNKNYFVTKSKVLVHNKKISKKLKDKK